MALLPPAFISYRRDDSAAEANYVALVLRRKLGDGAVFLDTSSVNAGAPWPKTIREALDESQTVIALIGPDWLRASDEYGRRFLDHESDWVREELRFALERAKDVVPVLLRGSQLPPPDALPDDLKLLAERQRVEIRGQHFAQDWEALISQFEPVAAPQEASVASQVADELRRLGARRRRMALEVQTLATEAAVYEKLLGSLAGHGWQRFAAGFKAGIYGHLEYPWIIKLLGMGVGERPEWYVGRGEVIEHERVMLEAFQEAGFSFQPAVLSRADSVQFLEDACGVGRREAERLVSQNCLLILEYLDGLPLVTETGQGLRCTIESLILRADLSEQIVDAIGLLSRQLDRANEMGLLHNDPWPANLLLTLDPENQLALRLVDFDLAQDWRSGRAGPDYVMEAVEQQKRDRNVPRHPQTGAYMKNLDQHLIAETIQVMRYLRSEARLLLRGVPIQVLEFGGASFKVAD